MSTPAERVALFLNGWAGQGPGIDQNLIHSVANRNTDHEPVELTTADLRAVLSELDLTKRGATEIARERDLYARNRDLYAREYRKVRDERNNLRGLIKATADALQGKRSGS